MNNNEYYFDVERLYNIALRLKTSSDERKGAKAILAHNPSRSMNERYDHANKMYETALEDFSKFVDDYIIFERKDEISKIQINRIVKKIGRDIDKVFEEYKNEEEN